MFSQGYDYCQCKIVLKNSEYWTQIHQVDNNASLKLILMSLCVCLQIGLAVAYQFHKVVYRLMSMLKLYLGL